MTNAQFQRVFPGGMVAPMNNKIIDNFLHPFIKGKRHPRKSKISLCSKRKPK